MGALNNHIKTPDGLASKIKGSDRDAFNALFEMLWQPMYGYAASLLTDKVLAEDLVQEVWIDYWQRRGEVEIHNIKSYLYKAIRYKCYNSLRDRKFNKIQIEAAHGVGVSPEMELQEDVMELNRCIDLALSGLPNRCRQVFILSRVNQVCNKEIAKRLNISQRSVENQLSFALRRLRKELFAVHSLFQ